MNPESLKRFEQGVVMAGIEQQVEANLDADQVRRLILGLDERQADLDFTVRLVSDLAESVAGEVAADESEPKTYLVLPLFEDSGNEGYVYVDELVATLSTEPPSRIVEIMGRALAEARKMAEGADELLNSPCTHEGDCGCSEAKIHLDLVSRPEPDWTTPRGIQRLEKMVADAVEENAMCSVCGHPDRNHNRGPDAIPCLPGLGYLACHACNINHKEK